MNNHNELGCFLPFAQSAVTALLVGSLAFTLAMTAGMAAGRAALAGLAFGLVGALAMWLTGLAYWRKLTAPVQEYYYPEVETEPAQTVRVEVQHDANHVQFVDLPADIEQLAELAQGVLSGASLAESAWTGAGGLFTRAEFAKLRGELLQRGLVQWVREGSPAQGVALTPPGRAAFRMFAGMANSPTPGADTR